MVGWDVAYKGSFERAVGTKSFRFERPHELDYVPGQFGFFSIPRDGETLRHHFTLSSSPSEPFVEFTTRMTGSEYKNTMDALPTGTTVRLEGVQGRFTVDESMQKVSFTVGGIGVTPARSLARWAADTDADLDYVLLYANRDEASTAFKQEFDAIDHPGFKVAYVYEEPEPGWTGLTGRIDADMVRATIADWAERYFFVSGPPAMVQAIESVLKDGVGVDAEHLAIEHFTGY